MKLSLKNKTKNDEICKGICFKNVHYFDLQVVQYYRRNYDVLQIIKYLQTKNLNAFQR